MLQLILQHSLHFLESVCKQSWFEMSIDNCKKNISHWASSQASIKNEYRKLHLLLQSHDINSAWVCCNTWFWKSSISHDLEQMPWCHTNKKLTYTTTANMCMSYTSWLNCLLKLTSNVASPGGRVWVARPEGKSCNMVRPLAPRHSLSYEFSQWSRCIPWL